MYLCGDDSSATCGRTTTAGGGDAGKGVCNESDRKGLRDREGSIAAGSFLPAEDRTIDERDTRSAAARFASRGRASGPLGPITEFTQTFPALEFSYCYMGRNWDHAKNLSVQILSEGDASCRIHGIRKRSPGDRCLSVLQNRKQVDVASRGQV